MGLLHTVAAWAGLLVSMALSVAYVGVGATIVRKAKPVAGYLLVAGGAFGFVLACCISGTNLVTVENDTRETLGILLGLLDLAHTLVFGGCLIGAAVVLTNAARAADAD